MMSASFGRRMVAQIIDIFIVGIIISVVSFGFNTNRIDSLNKEVTSLMNGYVDGDVSTERYIQDMVSINYEINKASVNSNLVYLVVCIGYFLVFQYLNGGVSIGKKLMNIRIVSKDNKEISFLQMFIRTSIVNEIIPMGIVILLVFVSSGFTFFIGYSIISFVENLFIMICIIMILCRKDKLALHDIMSHSMVIREND